MAVFFTVAGILLLGASVISTVSSVDAGASASLSFVKEACQSTRFPGICYESIASAHKPTDSCTTHMEVIKKAINLTMEAVHQNKGIVSTLRKKHSFKTKGALADCMETLDDSLEDLHDSLIDLRAYGKKKSLKQHADDLKTLISTALTDQQTCLDGFSDTKTKKKIPESFKKRAIHAENLCSIALSLIKNMTDNDMKSEISSRKLKEMSSVGNWPSWLSTQDRRMLQTPATPNVVVAADGSGDYKTITEAVEKAVPDKSEKRIVIRIKAGVYRENVEVKKKKANVMFVGDDRHNTVITASKNVADGSTTFHSATVAVVGPGFLAKNLTFENTAGPAKHQAVALRVGSDLSAFYECNIIGYQDSLYVHSNRQFFKNCLITGTVDFIFGNGAAVLQNCDILARKPGPNQKIMITAQGRIDPGQNTGIVIHNCNIGANSDLEPVKNSFPTYLGRPWKEYSRTVIMQTSISDVVKPEGWHEWNGHFALNTLFYGEYNNTGAGAVTDKRVKWKGFKVITDRAEAETFTVGRFIGGDVWLQSTTFPFTLGL